MQKIFLKTDTVTLNWYYLLKDIKPIVNSGKVNNIMYIELSEIYEKIAYGSEYMNSVDKKIENEIDTQLSECNNEADWHNYEEERDKYIAVANIAKKEAFIQGFTYAVRIMEECHYKYNYNDKISPE